MAPDFVEKLSGHLQNGAVLAHGIDVFYNAPSYRNILRGFWCLTKPASYTTGRGVAIRTKDFWDIGGYDENCDPMANCREDKDLGMRVLEHFGPQSIVIDRTAAVAEESRRPYTSPFSPVVWPERGWRKGLPVNKRLLSLPKR